MNCDEVDQLFGKREDKNKQEGQVSILESYLTKNVSGQVVHDFTNEKLSVQAHQDMNSPKEIIGKKISNSSTFVSKSKQ